MRDCREPVTESVPPTVMIVFRLLAVVVILGAGLLIDTPAQIVLRRLHLFRFADALQMAFSSLLCAAMGLRVIVAGDPETAGPTLIVANHVSWTDIPALASVKPLTFLAKREVGSWPILGWLTSAHGTLFVERTRWRALPAVNRQIATSLQTETPVVLFAEATTGDGTRLLRFHAAHLASARELLRRRQDLGVVWVKPVSIICSSTKGLPAGYAERLRHAWFGDTFLIPNLLDLLALAPLTCEIIWGEALPYARETNRKVLMRAVREAVKGNLQQRLRAPLTAPSVVASSPDATPVNGSRGKVWSARHMPDSSANPGLFL